MLALILSEAALARLGESPIQCFRRYGGKVTKESFVGDAKEIAFTGKVFEVTALFVRNKAEFLVFRRFGSLSETDARFLLDKHEMDVSQEHEIRCHQRVGNKLLEAVRWTFPNYIAVFNPLHNTLTLCSAAFSDAATNGKYDSAKDVLALKDFAEHLNSSTPLTSGEVAVLEASFASEEASQKSEEASRNAAIASKKAALTALEAQEESLRAQAQALDSQRSALFRRNPQGSASERNALENARQQILKVQHDVAAKARELRFGD
ncbi:MAG: hypothetical protein WCI38_03475 [Chthoniobacterales bacterium]